MTFLTVSARILMTSGVALIALLPKAQAQVLYSAGFEAPGYTTGLLAGQQGWASFGNGLAQVVASEPFSGTQALVINPNDLVPTTIGLDITWYDPAIAINTSTTRRFLLEGDLRLDGPTIADDNVSANLLFYDTTKFDTLSEVYVSSDGNIYADNADGSYLLSAPGGTNTYFHIGELLDLNAKTESLYVNGVLMGTLGLPASGVTATAIQPELTMVAVSGFDYSGYSAHFDNIKVSAVSAPEPSTLLFSLVGLLGLTRRRKD